MEEKLFEMIMSIFYILIRIQLIKAHNIINFLSFLSVELPTYIR
jgi:hypothetical protein